MLKSDAYNSLSLDPNEQYTEQDIKSAYRKMARIHHPDKNSNSKESKERFQEVSEAYRCIMKGDYDTPDESIEMEIRDLYRDFASIPDDIDTLFGDMISNLMPVFNDTGNAMVDGMLEALENRNESTDNPFIKLGTSITIETIKNGRTTRSNEDPIKVPIRKLLNKPLKGPNIELLNRVNVDQIIRNDTRDITIQCLRQETDRTYFKKDVKLTIECNEPIMIFKGMADDLIEYEEPGDIIVRNSIDTSGKDCYFISNEDRIDPNEDHNFDIVINMIDTPLSFEQYIHKFNVEHRMIPYSISINEIHKKNAWIDDSIYGKSLLIDTGISVNGSTVSHKVYILTNVVDI